ncbi:hypothetical protein ACSBR1_010782 [Camellia fascicularis]
MLLMVKFQYPEGHVSKSIYATFRLVSAPPTSGCLLTQFVPCHLDYYSLDYTNQCSVVGNSKLQYAVVEVHALSGDASTSPGDGKKRLGNVLKE